MIMPCYYVVDLPRVRSILVEFGFVIVDGSTKHAILMFESMRLKLVKADFEYPIYLTISTSRLAELALKHTISIQQLGWGQETIHVQKDLVNVTYTQAKPVYQA